MLDFFKKLTAYIKNMKNNEEDTCEPFSYKNTVLEVDIAQLIYSLWCSNNHTEEMYDKECDYNRLLRQENMDLKEELDYMYSKEDENKNIVIEYNNEDLPS